MMKILARRHLKIAFELPREMSVRYLQPICDPRDRRVSGIVLVDQPLRSNGADRGVCTRHDRPNILRRSNNIDRLLSRFEPAAKIGLENDRFRRQLFRQFNTADSANLAAKIRYVGIYDRERRIIRAEALSVLALRARRRSENKILPSAHR